MLLRAHWTADEATRRSAPRRGLVRPTSAAHHAAGVGACLLAPIGAELMRAVVMYLEDRELHVEVAFAVATLAIAAPRRRWNWVTLER